MWTCTCIVLRQVDINFRIYWQLDYSPTTRCNRETIASGQLIGPETPGYLECVDGCTPTGSRVSDVSIRCAAYSVLENWMYGVRSSSYSVPASAAGLITLEYGVSSNCFAHPVNPTIVSVCSEQFGANLYDFFVRYRLSPNKCVYFSNHLVKCSAI